jgi:hypothetical protein
MRDNIASLERERKNVDERFKIVQLLKGALAERENSSVEELNTLASQLRSRRNEEVVAVSGGEYKVAEPSAEEVQFFSSTENVVHVFDFDYDLIESFTLPLMFRQGVLTPFCFWPLLCPAWFCCGKQNAIDDIRAKHVCVTTDGIRFVHDRHRQACRMNCDEAGKVTKTIPFDKLTDCDIEEPAGSSGPVCCMVPNTLTIVNVDTASGARGPPAQPGMSLHELQLVGLKDPHGFKSVVWRMKRSGGAAAAALGATGSPAVQAMSRADTSVGEMVPLLKKQNDLLERQNTLLEAIEQNTRS